MPNYNKKHMDDWGFVLGKTKCYLCGKILTYNNAFVQLGTWVRATWHMGP